MNEKLITLVRALRVSHEQQKLQHDQYKKQLESIEAVLSEAENYLKIPSPE
tara:strand:- start:6031 stop:6183 length:153 start_codon:yes stop_codon:yes gene_type:complete